MLSANAPRRRALKRAPLGIRRLGALAIVRERLVSHLSGYDPSQRAVLAMLLLERLTPAEAARALDLSIDQVARLFRALLTDLRRAGRGTTSTPLRRAETRLRIVALPRQRRA